MAMKVLDVRVLILVMLSVFLFSLIATFIVLLLIRGIGQAQVPRMSIPATVVRKRQEGGANYVTFQRESGECAEVAVSAAEYGLLAEGDAGELTVQGKRYLGFVRT